MKSHRSFCESHTERLNKCRLFGEERWTHSHWITKAEILFKDFKLGDKAKSSGDSRVNLIKSWDVISASFVYFGSNSTYQQLHLCGNWFCAQTLMQNWSHRKALKKTKLKKKISEVYCLGAYCVLFVAIEILKSLKAVCSPSIAFSFSFWKPRISVLDRLMTIAEKAEALPLLTVPRHCRLLRAVGRMTHWLLRLWTMKSLMIVGVGVWVYMFSITWATQIKYLVLVLY